MEHVLLAAGYFLLPLYATFQFSLGMQRGELSFAAYHWLSAAIASSIASPIRRWLRCWPFWRGRCWWCRRSTGCG
ncbi:hypothetical protein [Salinicola tamaricis]|uniref:hypothetical protein n=1 Tax=Salinicola tamaricis TaxID=1771309 RepID=UPI001A939830|nr:hypothetical protein [Salinicola tamaricis]